MRHIILHYHFFKNAGSTFAAALEHNFGKNFASFDSEHYNRRLHPQELVRFVQENPHLVAISSHHLNPLAPHVEGIQFHEVVILRNPVDRIRSMYDFFRRERISEDPLTYEAKRLSLPAFLELLIETRPHLITNPQLNLIARGGAAIPSRQDMDRAALFLKTVAVIGVVERFDLCALGAEQSLSRVFPHCDLSYVPENVSQGRASDLRTRLQRFAATCGDHLYRRVVNLNELDSELVEIAAAESLRRFQEMASPEASLRSFRRRVRYRKILSGIAKRRARVLRLWSRTMRIISRRQESQA